MPLWPATKTRLPRRSYNNGRATILSPTETPAAGDGMMTGVGTEKNAASATLCSGT